MPDDLKATEREPADGYSSVNRVCDCWCRHWQREKVKVMTPLWPWLIICSCHRRPIQLYAQLLWPPKARPEAHIFSTVI